MARTKIHRPSIFDNINFVIDALQIPCYVGDPIVVIQTFAAATLPTLIAFNQFSCIDIIAARAGITWKCGKSVKAATRQGIAPWAKSATDFLYRMGPEQVRRVLWYYFIVEQATAFAARWTSLLYTNSACTVPPNGQYIANATITQFGLIGVGVDRPILMLSFVGDQCFRNTGGGYIVHAGCNVGCMTDLPAVPIGPEFKAVNIRIYIVNSGGDTVGSTTSTGDESFQSQSAFHWQKEAPGGILSSIEYEIRVTNEGPGVALCDIGHVTFYSSGYKSEIVPTGCVPKSAHL